MSTPTIEQITAGTMALARSLHGADADHDDHDYYRKHVEVTLVAAGAAPQPAEEDNKPIGPTLRDLAKEAKEAGEWCCDLGCGTGACESCPCCSAGWCVSGADGVPENAEDRARWMDVATEYNPLVALALATQTGAAPQSEPGKRLDPEFRAELVDITKGRIQEVWDDVPAGVDAETLAQNVVGAQEFAWIARGFPINLKEPGERQCYGADGVTDQKRHACTAS